VESRQRLHAIPLDFSRVSSEVDATILSLGGTTLSWRVAAVVAREAIRGVGAIGVAAALHLE
jgi:hypothetical protein